MTDAASFRLPEDEVVPMAVDSFESYDGVMRDAPAESFGLSYAHHRDRRRKRRRQLYQMLQRPGAVPSFLAVITQTNKDIDEMPESTPPVVIIDVDEYIGLKKPPPPTPDPAISSATFALQAGRAHLQNKRWYEGCIPFAQDTDQEYLTELQQFAKRNLQLFSASEVEVEATSGRKHPIIRGRIGLRCLHCATALLGAADSISYKSTWPAGAISYPASIAALYTTANSKPHQHFEKQCPYLPPEEGAKLEQLLENSRASQSKMQGTASPTRPRRRMAMNSSQYYAISCHSLGVYEVPDGQGLRFGRETSEDPLDFETARKEVEEIAATLQDNLPAAQEQDAAIPAATVSSYTPQLRQRASTEPRIRCDPETQILLNETLADSEKDSRILGRSIDLELGTDYMFLTVMQMAMCRASSGDMSSRGKKNKMVHVGFCGFCCRHCLHGEESGSSDWVTFNMCRSFCSHPDNLASAIANSFSLHLQKCPNTPLRLKKALSLAKKVHSRQMQSMPYGSQRQLFHRIWGRMRELDHSKSGRPSVNAQTPKAPRARSKKDVDDEFRPDDEDAAEPEPDEYGSSASNSRQRSTSATTKSKGSGARKSAPIPSHVPMGHDRDRPNSRTADFPICTDPDTVAILSRYESEWDQNENERLITPDLRHLVSDYVFVTARQLQIATPTSADFSRNRRNNLVNLIAGFCCVHCARNDKDGNGLSGRSFPSAPDNMASALNSSLYSHFQNCDHTPIELKKPMAYLRKIHSAQCSALQFGSQRKFFNIVFDRLRKIPIDQQLVSATSRDVNPVQSSASQRGASGKTASLLAARPKRSPNVPSQGKQSGLTMKNLRNFKFTKRSFHVQCLRCRMVPFELRSPGSIIFLNQLNISDADLRRHQASCKGTALDNGVVRDGLNLLLKAHPQLGTVGNYIAEFEDLVSSALGNKRELCKALLYDSSNPANVTDLPTLIDEIHFTEAFKRLVKKLQWTQSSFSEYPHLSSFLQLVSPHLTIRDDTLWKNDDTATTSDGKPSLESGDGDVDENVDDVDDHDSERDHDDSDNDNSHDDDGDDDEGDSGNDDNHGDDDGDDDGDDEHEVIGVGYEHGDNHEEEEEDGMDAEEIDDDDNTSGDNDDDGDDDDDDISEIDIGKDDQSSLQSDAIDLTAEPDTATADILTDDPFGESGSI